MAAVATILPTVEFPVKTTNRHVSAYGVKCRCLTHYDPIGGVKVLWFLPQHHSPRDKQKNRGISQPNHVAGEHM